MRDQTYKEIYNSITLRLFFKIPEGVFHIREISRKTGLHPNTVLKEVRLLEKEGLLTVKNAGNLKQVKATREELFIRIKRIDNLKNVVFSGVLDMLYRQYGAPDAIVLFGSYSRGEDTSTSDIDIAVITNKEFQPDLSRFEKFLHRKIQAHEIRLGKVGKGFRTNLINGIVLSGYLDA